MTTEQEPDVDVTILPKGIRRELESLSDENRERVEVLLVKAWLCLDEDPKKASEFALQAAKSAGRLSLVREAAGVAAYRAGDYAVAKKELQAARRMSGQDDLIPIIADCERALGNPDRAIALAESPEGRKLRGEQQAELLLVVAGARADMGLEGEALSILETAAKQAPSDQQWAARLYYAYADTLLETGNTQGAKEWFSRSAAADVDSDLDSEERLAAIDGSS